MRNTIFKVASSNRYKQIGFVCFFTLGMFLSTNAQRLDYERLRATGPIPAEYTEYFTSKYLEAAQGVDMESNKTKRKRQDDFHKNNQYFLDEMMTSGKILYGDPVTNYLQEVMDYLLNVYGQTNKDIRVFTVRSTQFNAAATEDGILLVNLGLLAQVENEAQLAFILSHELIHTEENHVMEGFLEKLKIQKGEDAYRRQQSDEKLVAMSNYSKSHEFEADLEGYKRIFSKTNYDPEEALRVLDVMLYSYLPFDEVVVDKTFFNTTNFSLDTSFFPESVNGITAYEDYDDTKSTHPNLKARREALEVVIDKTPSNGKEWFIVNENAFFEAQELARFECSALFLADRNYPEALYNSFLLSRKHPDNKFLHKNVGIALHTFATYKNNENTKFIRNVTDVEGNIQSIYYMLDRLSSKGVSILATLYNFENHLRYPDDAFLKDLFERSLHELVFFHEVTDDDFETEFPIEEEEGEEEEEEEFTRRGRSSKVTKLSKSKRSEEDAYAYAFVNAFKNNTFKAAWESEQKDLKAFKKQSNYLSWHDRRVKGKTVSTPNGSRNVEKEKDPIHKVVVVTPRFLKLKQGNYKNNYKPIIKFEDTDIEQRKMRELIPGYLERVGLDAEFLDYKTLDKMDDDLFNDLMFVNDWLGEYWDHPRVENIVSSNDRAQEFIEKYGTQYIMYTGMITYHKQLERVQSAFNDLAIGAVGALMFPTTIFYSISSLTKPRGQVFQFVSVYDIKNGYTRFHFVENFDDKITRAELKAMIYDKMYRVAND